MKTSNYTVTILQPENGWLTQTQDIDIQKRVYSKKVFLAVTDKPENWKEITEEEYNEYQLQLEEFKKTIEK